MVFILEEKECIDLGHAASIITDYSDVLQKKLLDITSGKYKEHADIIEAYEMQLASVIDVRKDLVKIANRRGCNI